MGDYRLGQIYGLELSVRPSAIGASLIGGLTLAGIATLWLGLSLGAALLWGFLAVISHWLSSLVHHLGHAWAARQTGHPMTGIIFWGLLGTSVYPANEGALPPAVHIRRALGGPLFSLGLTLVLALLLLVVPQSGVLALLTRFAVLENLLVYTLQIVIPLGFNDASTILTWARKR